jgi:hypothetical protein
MNSAIIHLSDGNAIRTSINGAYNEVINYYLGQPITRSDETTKDYVLGVTFTDGRTGEERLKVLTPPEIDNLKTFYGIKEFAK